MKLPDLLGFKLNKSMSSKESKRECLKNCNCSAYAKSNISGHGSRCLIWYGDLIDVGEFIDKYAQQDMYVRLPSSEIDLIHALKRKGKRLVTNPARVKHFSYSCFLGSIWWYIIWNKRKKGKETKHSSTQVA